MIHGFDHVVIAVRDLARAQADYAALLGSPAIETGERDGVGIAIFAVRGVGVELMAPIGPTESARRLGAALEEGGEGLKSIVFAVSDIEAAHHRAGRVGLSPEPISARDLYASFRLATAKTHGARVFLLARATPTPTPEAEPASPQGLDHIVLHTSDADRAAALYGARLGLDLRLDRDVAGRRMLFFRCGESVLEVVQNAPAGQPDRFWGLSWRVADAEAAQERLKLAGFDVSEVRQGAKPRTRVFTVRSRTGGVPTLFLEPSPKRD